MGKGAVMADHGQAFLGVANADEGRKAAAEQRQCQAGRVLIGVQPNHQKAEKCREYRGSGGARQERDGVVFGGEGDGKAGDGRDQHQALCAQVDHARALVDDQAECCQQERRAGVDRRTQQQQELVHLAAACLVGARREAQLVLDERVAGQQREQEQSLKYAGDRLGQPETRLRQLTADEEHAHQHRRERDADRIESADEGDDDRGKAVAQGHVRGELTIGAGHFQRAGQACQGTREQERQPERAACGEARVARGSW